MTTIPRRVIEVSKLPPWAYDQRSAMWWGNLLMIFIETMTVALLIATYFYLRQNYEQWPPPKVDVFPPLLHPVPDLLPGTINLVLLAIGCAVFYVTDQFARKLNKPAVLIGLSVILLLCAICSWLRWLEFSASKFWWNDNAYASTVWTILGLHLLYILSAMGEAFIMWLWLVFHPIDHKHGHDVTLLGGFWYWTAGTWLLLWFVVYICPRVM